MSREIVEVYADWQPIEAPLLIGLLSYSNTLNINNLPYVFGEADHPIRRPLVADEKVQPYKKALYLQANNRALKAFLDG